MLINSLSSNRSVADGDVLVISPHVDDAAFSVGATLKRLVTSGRRVRILNCFTESHFAPFVEMGGNLSQAAVTDLRSQEEAHFLRCLGGVSSSESLGIPDAHQRGGLRNIFVKDTRSSDIANAISLLCGLLPDCRENVLILAPLALGHHSDHYAAREATLARYMGLSIAFYEDQPYVAALSREQVDAVIATLSCRCNSEIQPLLLRSEDAVAWKRICCSCYQSQVSSVSIERMMTYVASLEGERLWGTVSSLDRVRASLLAGHGCSVASQVAP